MASLRVLTVRVLLIAAFAATTAWSRPAPGGVAEDIDAALKTLREVVRPLEGYSAEGTAVTAFLSGRVIRKISVELLGERGKEIYDFYWNHGRLIRFRHRSIEYGASIMEIPADQATPEQLKKDERMDFAEGGMLSRWSDLDGPRSVTAPNAKSSVALAKETARSYFRLMSRADPRKGCSWRCATWLGEQCKKFACE